MTKLQELQEAIIKVVPPRLRTCACRTNVEQLPTQLADVLLAIKENRGYSIVTISESGVIEWKSAKFTKFVDWDLTKPLEQQDTKTIDFVHGIICQS